MKNNLILTTALLCATAIVHGQTQTIAIKQANISSANPNNAEIYTPLPNVVVPGKTFSDGEIYVLA